MNNTRFATAIHIMTLLADHSQEWMGSDFIAASININPVVVRKEISVLSHAGLVISRRGKEGGSMLNRSATDITLNDIYQAVRNSEILGKRNREPNPKCKIGRQINKRLDDLFNESEAILADFLRNKTLAFFSRQF
jgi:Rrf2 family protein